MPKMRLIPTSISSAQKVKFFIHLIVICIIFFLPEMLMSYSRPHHGGRWEMLVYVKSAFYVGAFYVNYYFILNHSIFAKKRSIIKFLGLNVALIMVVFASLYLYQRFFIQPIIRPRPHLKDIPARVLLAREWSFYLRDLAMLVLSIALSVALKFTENWTAIEKKHEQLLASQRADELNSLKSQLNPHFLFNTLNTIYSLIDISPAEAQKAVHQLSKLLRYVLYENPATVRLSQEVDFARSYISLMEMRLGEGAVKTEFVNDCNCDLEIAPLLFITLIENAFKHGNATHNEIPIELSIVADKDGVITCRTKNGFVPAPIDSAEYGKRANSGIGLTNLNRRLHLIYGDRANLSTTIDGNLYIATLTINQ